jgi:hypothetical protein
MDKLKVVGMGFLGQVAAKILPWLQKFVDWGIRAGATLLKMAEDSNIFKAVMITLAVVMGAFGAAALAAQWPLILMALAIAAVVLIVDELITLFNGGDTLIGDAIDEIFGEGKSTELVKEVKEIWKEVVEFVKGAYEWVKKYSDEIRLVYDIVSKLTSLPLKALQMPAEFVRNLKFKGSLPSAEELGNAAINTGSTLAAWSGVEREKARPSVSALYSSAPAGSVVNQSNANTINITTNNPEEMKRAAREVFSENMSTAYDAAAPISSGG